MSNKNSKIITIISGILGLLTLIFYVRILWAGESNIENDADMQNSLISPFVWYAVIMLIICALVALLSSVLHIIMRPKALKTTLIALVAFVVLFLIAYIPASDAAVHDGLGRVLEDGEQGATSKWIGGLLTFSMILGAISLVGFLVDFVKSLVK